MSEPTDRQLRGFVYHLARAYLEIERGLRSPEQLRDYLTRGEYLRQRLQPRTRVPHARPALPEDLGNVALDRSQPDQITATITTREHGQRRGALVVHLAHVDHEGGWRVDQLERLTRTLPDRQPQRDTPNREPNPEPNAVQEPAPPHEPPDTLEQRLRRAEDERTIVVAAQGATEAHLRDRHHSPTRQNSRQALTRQHGMWARRLAELDRELAELRETKQHRDRATARQPATTPDRGETTRLSSEQFQDLLGPKPTDPQWARLWETATGEINTYRERWHITDPRSALGPAPEDPDSQQGRDRERVAELLRTLAPGLRRDRSHEQGREQTSRGRDDHSSPDRGLDGP